MPNAEQRAIFALEVADPTVGAGVLARVGDVGFTNTNPPVFYKFNGEASTNWTVLSSGEGSALTELGVADPTQAPGVAAGIGTVGQTNETPARFFRKTDSADTGWSLILMADSDGVVAANVALDDATGIILGDQVLGRVGNTLVLGDGVSLAESLRPVLGRQNMTLINKRTATLTLTELGFDGIDTFNDPTNGWFSTSPDVFNPEAILRAYQIDGTTKGNFLHHDGSAAPEGWYNSVSLTPESVSDPFLAVGDLFEAQRTNPTRSMGGRYRADYFITTISQTFSSVTVKQSALYEFKIRYKVFNPDPLASSFVVVNVSASSGTISLSGFMSKINSTDNPVTGDTPSFDISGNLAGSGNTVTTLPTFANWTTNVLFYEIDYLIAFTVDTDTTISFAFLNGEGCSIDIIEAIQL